MLVLDAPVATWPQVADDAVLGLVMLLGLVVLFGFLYLLLRDC